jgi:hypothetical protein
VSYKNCQKEGMVVQACNPSTWEAEAGESLVEIRLGSTLVEFQASLSYIPGPCPKKMTEVAEKNDNEIELTDQEYLSYKSFY